MKKSIILFFLTTLTAVGVSAQNLQLHYDFGRHIYSTEEKGRQDTNMPQIGHQYAANWKSRNG